MPGQSGPWSNGNEGVLRIPQSSITAGTSPSDCLVSYPGHSFGGGSYPSAEVQSVYSTAPDDWPILALGQTKLTLVNDQFTGRWRTSLSIGNVDSMNNCKKTVIYIR